MLKASRSRESPRSARWIPCRRTNPTMSCRSCRSKDRSSQALARWNRFSDSPIYSPANNAFERINKRPNQSLWNRENRVVNGPLYKPEPEITNPNPVRAWHLFLKPNLGPKDKFTEWVEICANAGYVWRSKPNMNEHFTVNHFHCWRFHQLRLLQQELAAKSAHLCEKVLYAGPKSAWNISTNLTTPLG